MDQIDQMAMEREFLDQKVTSYDIGSRYVDMKRHFAIRSFEKYLKPEFYALELGCSDGVETSLLAGKVEHLDVVDGSSKFVEEQKKHFENRNVEFHCSLFEEFLPENEDLYDAVFANYVLEHVIDTNAVFHMVKRVLKKEGTLFAVVPNAQAASRQLAVHMGLLKGVYELTQNDLDHGHRRVFDQESFIQSLEEGGFQIVETGGILFKPFADFQLTKLLDDRFLTQEHMEGLYKLGEEYPQLTDSIFAVCKPR